MTSRSTVHLTNAIMHSPLTDRTHIRSFILGHTLKHSTLVLLQALFHCSYSHSHVYIRIYNYPHLAYYPSDNLVDSGETFASRSTYTQSFHIYNWPHYRTQGIRIYRHAGKTDGHRAEVRDRPSAYAPSPSLRLGTHTVTHLSRALSWT